jgi:hypothetical protein
MCWSAHIKARARRAVGPALAAGIAVILSGCGGAGTPGSKPSSGAGSGGPGAVRPAGVDPVLLSNFRILRRAAQAEDRLPPELQRLAAQPRQAARLATLGLLPALARRAVVPGTRLEQWLEPGRNGFCLRVAERNPSGSANFGGFGSQCGPARITLSATVGGGAFLAAGPPLRPGAPGSPALATGIVPDRVGAVELVTRNGVTTNLQLADGFFATRLAAGDRLYALIGTARQIIGAR